jgi:hypothetical protein
MRHNRREMLEGYRQRQLYDRRTRARFVDAAARFGVHGRQVVARAAQQLVEDDVLTRVHRFLLDERGDLLPQRLIDLVAVAPNGLDEERLSLREGRGQRIEVRGRDRVAAVPPARVARVTVHPQVARRDREIGGGRGCGHARY